MNDRKKTALYFGITEEEVTEAHLQFLRKVLK